MQPGGGGGNEDDGPDPPRPDPPESELSELLNRLSTSVALIDVDLPLCRKLQMLLAKRWKDAGEEVPRLEPIEYRRIAARLWAEAELDEDANPRCLAFAHGIESRPAEVHGCYGEQTDREIILFRLRGGPREWGLRVFHGIAHWALWKRKHNEADVWLLTIALAVQRWRLSQLGPELFLAEREYVPEWLVRACWVRLTR